MHDYKYNGYVFNVVDGDTLDVELQHGFNIISHQRLRLARINTPEMNSPVLETREKAKQARSWVITSVLDKKVIVESHKIEKYGRYLAEVYYIDSNGKEVNLNDELLANGLAEKYE